MLRTEMELHRALITRYVLLRTLQMALFLVFGLVQLAPKRMMMVSLLQMQMVMIWMVLMMRTYHHLTLRIH